MFKKDFVWGAATAAYQIEGAYNADGKGRSVWDVFCEGKDKIFEGQNGNIACDHYNRFREDVRLMAEMGLRAYRFSVSWARIIPDGTGEVNQKGIDFYNALIDELLKNGIEPYMTLYHWDLPYELHKKGGWLNPEIADWFAHYAEVVTKAFSDRVKNFITVNEPSVFVGCGYLEGVHAPGAKLEKNELLQICHNVLTAHGKAVKVMRQNAAQPIKIGVAIALCPSIPETESYEDIAAAMKTFTCAGEDSFVFTTDHWLDPIVFGKYPDKTVEMVKKALVTDDISEDLAIIGQPIDFIGANIYNGNVYRADSNGNPQYVKLEDGFARTAIQWPVTSDALYWGAREVCGRYGLPFYISENGMSAHDWVSLDGEVHDCNRIDYMQRYLLGFERAADEGLPVAGYFAWSFLDNFEWAKGYNERFGLVFTDYRTQQRTVKDSGKWYSEVIRSNGELLHKNIK